MKYQNKQWKIFDTKHLLINVLKIAGTNDFLNLIIFKSKMFIVKQNICLTILFQSTRILSLAKTRLHFRLINWKFAVWTLKFVLCWICLWRHNFPDGWSNWPGVSNQNSSVMAPHEQMGRKRVLRSVRSLGLKEGVCELHYKIIPISLQDVLQGHVIQKYSV